MTMELFYNILCWEIWKALLFLSPVREIRCNWSVTKEYTVPFCAEHKSQASAAPLTAPQHFSRGFIHQ